MLKYAKHRIWRIRPLNDRYYEILIDKQSLKFVPGSAVTLYNGDEPPIFIASGVSEAWARLILDRERSPHFDLEASSMKLNSGVQQLIPTLFGEEFPSFLLTSEGIAPFLSYVSTFPHKKCTVCYIGDNIYNKDWIDQNQNVVDLDGITSAPDLYVLGNRNLIERVGDILNNCKSSYLV